MGSSLLRAGLVAKKACELGLEVRVEKMFEDVQSKLPGPPKILLCLLPERKNCDLYGILGGLNSLLAVEQNPSIPLVSKVLTIILGMDVSHGSPGHSDVPSIAACEHPLNCCLMLLLLLLGSLVVYHPYHDFLMYLAHYPKVLLPDPFESVQLKVEGLVGNIDREMLR
ncbi:hypothetical protein Cgig2_033934 [Carnegiea gigantea]|uniref:Uncharacterized protein n=1 Tax=Carnegiea gigantea TaxID=171969 RepID=A0A9Q1JF53_9CARY|nr:hypothetical protein Cgig2_033934 [Carnegiea gigantea]